MQQSTACLHLRGVQRRCVWAVGQLGVAACLACVTAAAVDRQARQSCLQVRSASECVLRLRTHSDTDHGHRTHLSDGRADSVHTVT